MPCADPVPVGEDQCPVGLPFDRVVGFDPCAAFFACDVVGDDRELTPAGLCVVVPCFDDFGVVPDSVPGAVGAVGLVDEGADAGAFAAGRPLSR
jgi:hypothetical protein